MYAKYAKDLQVWIMPFMKTRVPGRERRIETHTFLHKQFKIAPDIVSRVALPEKLTIKVTLQAHLSNFGK